MNQSSVAGRPIRPSRSCTVSTLASASAAAGGSIAIDPQGAVLGTARYASALSVDDFIRKQSIIAYSRERLRQTGADIVAFARSEDLTAHALAVQTRLDRA